MEAALAIESVFSVFLNRLVNLLVDMPSFDQNLSGRTMMIGHPGRNTPPTPKFLVLFVYTASATWKSHQ